MKRFFAFAVRRRALSLMAGLLAFSLPSSAFQHAVAGPRTTDNDDTSLLEPGVIVTSVAPGYAGAEAGLQKGDILLRWSRGNLHGEVDSPFTLWWLDRTQRPHGTVRIDGIRGQDHTSWAIGVNFWATSVHPRAKPILAAVLEEGEKLAGANNLHEALETWRVSVRGIKGPSWLRTWLLMQTASTLSNAGKKQAADDLYREAAEQSRTNDLAAYTNLMRTWGRQLWERDEWNQAQNTYKEAISTIRGTAVDPLFIANFLNALGINAFELGNYAEAEGYTREAIAIQEGTVPGSVEMASELQILGDILDVRGELDKSLEYRRRALAITQKIAPLSLQTENHLASLGRLEAERGDPKRARLYFQESERILRARMGGADEAVYIYILQGLAHIEAETGNLQQAEQYEQRALALSRKVQVPRGIAISLGHLGMLAFERNDLKIADSYLRESILQYEQLGIRDADFADKLYSLGEVLEQRGQQAEAGATYRKALALIQTLGPKSAKEADALAGLARLMLAEGQPAAAVESYQEALEALENQTGRIGGGDELRAGFRAKHENIYRGYAGLLVAERKPESAFQVVERSRGRMLLESLNTAHVDIRQGVDAGLLNRERALQTDIKAKSDRRIRLLSSQHTGDQIKAVEKEISDLTAGYQEVEGRIRAASPNYAALTQPQPLTARQIQEQLLDHESLLLEYSLGKEHSHVFAVTPDSLQVFELPGRAQVESAARRMYVLLTARNRDVPGETAAQKEQRWRTADLQYQQAARVLSQMILGPVASQMENKRLVIVADGALHYIPFAALPEPGTAEAQPLTVKHEVVSLPSASVLALLRQQYKDRKPAPNAVAVLADPVFDKNDPRVTGKALGNEQPRSTRGPASKTAQDDLFSPSLSAGLLTRSAADLGLQRNGQLALTRLRYTRQEADAIRAVAPSGHVLEAVDFQASRSTATSPDLANYRIVHFATHGLLNSKHPELSGLVLSLVDKNGKPQDGFLTLQDIYNMNLSADLVVLSACETGLGMEISGEGLIGLTRGFMYAGATRVVASLWKVSDVATAQLMAEFYRAMEKDGMPPAAALRAAQVKMWKQKRWSSPYYWAAFQIQGEWR